MKFQATIKACNDHLTSKLTITADNIEEAFQIAVKEAQRHVSNDTRLVVVKELPARVRRVNK